MNTNENTIDNIDIDNFLAEKKRYRNFVPEAGSWASLVQPDPFMVSGVETVSPF